MQEQPQTEPQPAVETEPEPTPETHPELFEPQGEPPPGARIGSE